MAKRTSGLTPLWKKSQINKLFKKLGESAEWEILLMLQQAGESFVNFSRQQAPKDSFYDHSKNLRNSIGYVVVRDGKIIGENFEQRGGGAEGVRIAKQLCSDLARTHSRGYVLIGVAGMKYAVHVEAIEGKDVITRATGFTEDHIKKVGQSLFNKLGI